MEAICKTWEKPLVIGEDALDFEGGGTDEFLSKERNGLGARNWRRKGDKVC